MSNFGHEILGQKIKKLTTQQVKHHIIYMININH